MCSYHSLIYSALNTGGKLSPITSPQLFRCLDGIDGRVLILPLVSPLHRRDNEFQQKTTASDFAGADSHPSCFTFHCTPPQCVLKICLMHPNRTKSASKSRGAIPKLYILLPLAMPWDPMKITQSVTRDSPGGGQHQLKTCLTSCLEYGDSLYKDWMAQSNDPNISKLLQHPPKIPASF